MPSILNQTQILKSLFDAGKLMIWPENTINAADPIRPLVVLIHGVGGSLLDMTDPLNNALIDEYSAYDVDDYPDDIDEGWHEVHPIVSTQYLQDLFESIREGGITDGLIELLNDLVPTDISASPPLDIANPSWFSFFMNEGFPVIAYAQQGANKPLDDANSGAYSEFQDTMQDIHENLLGVDSCRKIALLGHSRGGLIARRYVVEALKGDIGQVHENIVESKVRFLGTLNSPHMGSSLAEIPNFINSIIASQIPIPMISSILTDLLLNLVGMGEDYVDAREELSPLSESCLVVNINLNDLSLLGLDLGSIPGMSIEQILLGLDLGSIPGMSIEQIRISLSGDERIKRIRRASTSGDQPLLRRYFSPYIYTPSSFIPDPSVLLDYEAALEAFMDFLEDAWDFVTGEEGPPEPPLPKPFHWQKESLELPFSPVLEEKNFPPPSCTDFMVAIGLPPIPFPELHASRVDKEGGDVMVTEISGLMPYSHHGIISRHHGWPLWDNSYKSFILNHIPPSYCYPPFVCRLGDNVVELFWDRLPASVASDYLVVRYMPSGEVIPAADIRSDAIPNTETIFYDSVGIVGLLRYLISYRRLSSDTWVHEQHNEAYLESVSVGVCPVTIKMCQPDDGQDYIPRRTRVAASEAGDNYIVFSVTLHDLLTDCIGHDLVPKR